MSEQMPGLPGPRPDATSAGYWDAAGRGELDQVERASSAAASASFVRRRFTDATSIAHASSAILTRIVFP